MEQHSFSSFSNCAVRTILFKILIDHNIPTTLNTLISSRCLTRRHLDSDTRIPETVLNDCHAVDTDHRNSNNKWWHVLLQIELQLSDLNLECLLLTNPINPHPAYPAPVYKPSRPPIYQPIFLRHPTPSYIVHPLMDYTVPYILRQSTQLILHQPPQLLRQLPQQLVHCHR